MECGDVGRKIGAALPGGPELLGGAGPGDAGTTQAYPRRGAIEHGH
jgi:hypothetical protein